jgi:ferric-dicitrate binding protein FerR (iron transport regulator)
MVPQEGVEGAVKDNRSITEIRRDGRHRKVMVTLAVALSLLIDLGSTFAQSTQIATAQNAIGALVVVRPDGIEDRLQGKGSLQLFEGDVLRTEAASQALIEFKEGIQVALNENTTFKLLSRWEKVKGITRIIRLKQGEVWVKTGEGPKQLEVETPVATAAVRETEFNMKVQEDGQSTLTVIQGVVEFGTAFGTCPVRTSTISYGVQGKRCTKPAPTDVNSAIAWTQAILQ